MRTSPVNRLPVRRIALVLALAMVPSAPAMAADVEWSYEGETGPAAWGTLSPDYASCGTGLEQSPIDIPADAPVRPADVIATYGETGLTVVDNGHAIQVIVDEGSTALIDGLPYTLTQFHFHSPGEHVVAGAGADLEMHLVHASDSGTTAVVAVLLVEGDENMAMAPLLANLPDEVGTPVTVEGVSLDVDALLPADLRAVGYAGSLTTPPCTEGVRWHVLLEPVTISADQLATYRAVHDGTNRPVQPLNARELEAP